MRESRTLVERLLGSDGAAQYYHASRAEILAGLLEAKIEDSGLKPGDRLGTKEEIRTSLNFAVATVNEAVRLLVERGRVVVRPGLGGGVFVAEQPLTVRLGRMLIAVRGIDTYSLADATVVRNALDPVVMVDVAQHRTRRDVARLRSGLAQMAHVVGDSKAFLDANWNFHRTMASMCHNSVLSCIYMCLMDTIASAAGTVSGEAATADRRERLAIHVEIVDAIEARDFGRLADAVRRHSIVAVPIDENGIPDAPSEDATARNAANKLLQT